MILAKVEVIPLIMVEKVLAEEVAMLVLIREEVETEPPTLLVSMLELLVKVLVVFKLETVRFVVVALFKVESVAFKLER